jgi:hypothetical protein
VDRRLFQNAIHLVLDGLGGRTQAAEDVNGYTFPFPDQAEEEMFGADIVMPPATGFVDGELDNALGTRSEGGLRKGGTSPAAYCSLDSIPYLFSGDVELAENTHGNAAFFGDQAQENVLGTDKTMIQLAGFVASDCQHPAGPFCKAVEILSHVVFLSPVYQSYSFPQMHYTPSAGHFG